MQSGASIVNRIVRIATRRLSPRATVITGAALGLIAGAAVYGSVTSSAQTTAPAAFVAKAPAAAPASFANCAAGQTLEKNVCVIHVTKTVVVPAAAPAAAAAPASAGSAASPSAAKPASP